MSPHPYDRPTARQAQFTNWADSYDKVFRDLQATKTDVIKPGFFNPWRSELIVGTLIDCRIGNPPDGIKRFWVQITLCTTYEEQDVLVSVGDRHGNFTPVGHDGTLAKPSKERKVA